MIDVRKKEGRKRTNDEKEKVLLYRMIRYHLE